MRHLTILQYACAIAVTAVAVSCGRKPDHKTGDEVPSVDVALPVVESVTLYKTYPGYAIANLTAQVVGRVNGTLLSKNFESGSFVTKGQVLFTIESTKYRDAVAQAQAALTTAKSEYAYASRQYEALKKAFESDAVSQMEVIQGQSNMEQAQAAIKNAQAALGIASTNLAYCTVRAPFSGHITSGAVDVGNYINGEGTPVKLATLYDDSSVIIAFSIEDAQYERMAGAKGDPEKEALYRNVPLSFSEPLPHEYTADLSYTSPAVDKSTGTLDIHVRLDNSYGELRPGMYATVNLPYGNEPEAILVKDASIGTDQLGKYLYVVNDSDKVVYTPVEVGGLYHDSLRVVTKGITPGTRYVTSALLKVRDGMPVKPVTVK